MKILRLYYLLPPKLGGMERHIVNLSKFQSHEHEVSIFFNYGDKVSSKDVKLLSFVKLFKIRPLFLGIGVFYLAIIFRLLFIREKFDVVHIHGDWSSLVFLKLIKKVAKAKATVFTMHGQLTTNFAHQKLLPKLIKTLDLVFTTGSETSIELSKLSNVEVNIQPSGIDKIFFTDSTKKKELNNFHVISVANLFPVKNVDLIIEIAAKLENIKFSVIGAGPEKEKLQNIIIEKQLKNIELIGFKRISEVKEYYQQSDCFLLTSFGEGTPTSVLEAMACGLPIVSSNAGGIGNIVKEYKNGFVINDFDKNKYIEKIKLLKNSSDLLSEISINNRNLSQNYKWSIVADNITSKTLKIFNQKS